MPELTKGIISDPLHHPDDDVGLRHAAAGAVRHAFGLEDTQAVLGQASAGMAERYLKISKQKAE